jgi:hypothetical protein
MKVNESVESFINRVQNIVNVIHSHGVYLEDKRIVLEKQDSRETK